VPRAISPARRFRKVLIANRGEIALRIMRTCRDLGIGTVAVYSEADRTALHVRYADEAYAIGPALASQSYLCVDRILDAARASGSEAIHPGYGFLSENPDFARACEAAGLVFIGPPASAIELMGSKTAARKLAIEAGLPVVPGTANLDSLEQARRRAEELGYPVMLKASAGGGGKGMRLVTLPGELEAAWRGARAEAENAFGDPAVYLEKHIERPRHVEVQVLGDERGNLIYLGERECSLQRRHQKVMEECPSPGVDAERRRRMGEAAVNLARRAGYVNAGTVEFLADGAGNFYFLEMNTRLQVEHPVTELVAGVDLVREQLRIAAGEPLGLRQDEVQLRGSAIECRIYAEDPARHFFPSPGLIRSLRVPSGPGVRDDSGVYEGWRVPLEYDPLLSKLITWGRDRPEAIARMRRALEEYQVVGVQTNLAFFRRLLAHPDVLAGRLDTGLIERMMAEAESASFDRPAEDESETVALLAAAIHTLAARDSAAGIAPTASPPGQAAWKMAGREAALNSWPRR
jgi:acetyl-CoA carboxylase biotin carboxylase subunit